MFTDRIFRIAFFISALTHGVILLQNPNLNFFSDFKRMHQIEISYLKNTAASYENRPEKAYGRPELFKDSGKVTADRRTPPPFIDKEKIFGQNKILGSQHGLFTKPTLDRPTIITVRKKITLPSVDVDKINNPSYLSYYQIVREKIRRAAYQNYQRTDSGEVYLSFIISSDGYLKDVRLLEDRSSPQQYLRDISLRSITDASPFPNFPKELDYPQLSFNVVISFEVE